MPYIYYIDYAMNLPQLFQIIAEQFKFIAEQVQFTQINAIFVIASDLAKK